MSHTRKVCPHGEVISQCRCIAPHKATEVVWPCPLGDRHAGYTVVHPEAPRPDLDRSGYCAAGRHGQCPQRPGAPAPRCSCRCHSSAEGLIAPAQLPAGAPETPGPVPVDPPDSPGAAEGLGPRAFKACVFRTCDWTIAEPDSLFEIAALDSEIRVHLRTHRVEIELLTRYIQ